MVIERRPDLQVEPTTCLALAAEIHVNKLVNQDKQVVYFYHLDTELNYWKIVGVYIVNIPYFSVNVKLSSWTMELLIGNL